MGEVIIDFDFVGSTLRFAREKKHLAGSALGPHAPIHATSSQSQLRSRYVLYDGPPRRRERDAVTVQARKQGDLLDGSSSVHRSVDGPQDGIIDLVIQVPRWPAAFPTWCRPW